MNRSAGQTTISLTGDESRLNHQMSSSFVNRHQIGQSVLYPETSIKHTMNLYWFNCFHILSKEMSLILSNPDSTTHGELPLLPLTLWTLWACLYLSMALDLPRTYQPWKAASYVPESRHMQLVRIAFSKQRKYGNLFNDMKRDNLIFLRIWHRILYMYDATQNNIFNTKYDIE